jgi:hypothetical protein
LVADAPGQDADKEHNTNRTGNAALPREKLDFIVETAVVASCVSLATRVEQ